MLGGTKTNAKIIITPTKITKIYTKRGEKAFLNELKIYKLAKSKKVNFIPTLLRYNKETRTLVIANVGISLDKLSKEQKVKPSHYLPEIKKLYTKFKKIFKMHHNDLRYKNIVYNPKLKRFYLIDFEFTNSTYSNKNHQHILNKISNRILYGGRKKTRKREKYLK